MTAPDVRIDAMGESAVLVTLGTQIDPIVGARARALAAAVDVERRLGRAVPAYASVLVPFDPLVLSVGEATGIVGELVEVVEEVVVLAGPSAGRLVEVPVRYGGTDGPDLDDVARAHGLRPRDVVAFHSSVEYTAWFLGFAPGFAYLGPVPAPIATPRLGIPRPRVPAGSVAIAGVQTAIYPTETPGGWQLIGRTDIRPWDATRNPPALILAGDRVRFVPLT